VYEGSQGYLDRRVAVKLLAQESHGSEFTRRFQREAKILASLGHPNIVACYQAGVAPDGRCFLVMEFIDGPSLEGWIAKHGALPPATAARVCQAVASALAFAHGSGIIHRDVKPANVLLKSVAETSRDEGFPWQPMLADLGLARIAKSSPSSAKLDVTPQDLTVQGTVMGSPPTMAPEQFDAPDEVDFRTDVYGLGCVLFHALTGKQAFPQGSLTSMIARKTQGDSRSSCARCSRASARTGPPATRSC
jgi:serine/threonine protein kinase